MSLYILNSMDSSRNLAEYIAGFIDGEGCFSLSFRKDVRHERPGSPVYYSWKALFAIELRQDDHKVLIVIKELLGCGTVTYSQRGTARYQVGNLDELSDVLIPFFEQHPLIGKKKNDYELWKEAVKILWDQKHTKEAREEGLKKLVALHQAMRPFKGIYASKPLRQASEVPLGEI